MTARLHVVDAGRVPYERALVWQRRLVGARRREEVDDVLLLLEHEPVYTAGRHANTGAHVLGTLAIPVIATDRGGDVTYHGPGQVVAYPIVRLARPRAVRAHVGALLDAARRTVAAFGVAATVDLRRAGLWVGDEKLAAVGVRVDGGVSSHGIALNVDPDLSHFSGIVPCGIPDAGVCSLASLGAVATFSPGAVAALAVVRDRLAREIAAGLGRSPYPAALSDLPLQTEEGSTLR